VSRQFSLFNNLKLRNVVRNLNIGREIAPEESFLIQYDNGNSVWDRKEINKIRKDYHSGKLDNIFKDFLEVTAEDYNPDFEEEYLLQKSLNKMSNENLDRVSELLNINDATSKISNEVLLNIAKLDDNRYKVFKDLYFSGKYPSINPTEIEFLLNFNDKEFKIFEKYAYISERGDNQLSGIDIVALIQLNEKERADLDSLLVIEGRDSQISYFAAASIQNKSPEERKYITELLNLKTKDGRDRFNSIEFDGFAFYSYSGINKIKDLINIDGRGENQFCLEELAIFANLSPSNLNKLRSLVYVKERKDAQFSFKDIMNLLKQRDFDLEKVKDFLYIEGSKTQYSAADLVDIARLSEGDLNKVKPFMDIKTDDIKRFSGSDLINFANLTKEQLQVAQKYKYIDSRKDEQFTGDELIELAKMPINDRKNIEKFISIPGLETQLSLNTIKEVSQIFKDDYDTLIEIVNINPSISGLDLLSLGTLTRYNKENTLKFYSEHEHISFQFEQIISMEDNFCDAYDAKNNQLNETIYRTIDGVTFVDSRTITKFDKNNNIEEEKVYSKGEIPGVLNVTIKKNGEIKTVQYGIKDKQSGGINISKDLISPENVISSYDIEKVPDGTSVYSYKISDENGILLDRTLTVEKIDDKKMRTSVNGRVYEINLNSDTLYIKNLSDESVKILNLNDFVEDDETKELLSRILLNIPANLLEKLDSSKLKFIYDEELPNNGGARYDKSNSILTIHLGEQLYSDEMDLGLLQTFLHEFGHYLDFDFDTGDYQAISKDEDLIEIYKSEFNNYIENTDVIIQNEAGYLAERLDEMVAEVNMLIHGVPDLFAADRTTVIQEYFPRTIAKIAELIDNKSNN